MALMIKELKLTDLTKKLEHMTIKDAQQQLETAQKFLPQIIFFVFYLMDLHQKMLEEKYKLLKMLEEKKIIYIHINQVFLIMEKECEEI